MRVKQAMGPTRVTAAVPTPSHPLQFQKGRRANGRDSEDKDCRVRVAEALLKMAESNDGQEQ
jgi:hypothetical protein